MTNHELQPCLECSLALLERRPHSIAELSAKLRQRGFLPGIITAAVEELLRLSLLDDFQFAYMLIQEKLLSVSRPLGKKRIIMDLKRRGVEHETAMAAWREVEQGAQIESEPDRAYRAAEYKLKLIRRQSEDHKIREKLWRHLASRGFSGDSAAAAIERIMDSIS